MVMMAGWTGGSEDMMNKRMSFVEKGKIVLGKRC